MCGVGWGWGAESYCELGLMICMWLTQFNSAPHGSLSPLEAPIPSKQHCILQPSH